MRRAWLAGFALGMTLIEAPRAAQAACVNGVGAECVDRFVSLTGTLDFFATGASFAVNDDADDRPDRVLDEATVTIPERRIPGRARLVQAFIYFGGSLYQDNDGTDSADTDIQLRVPGATDFALVPADQIYQSGAIAGFPEVTLYTARADITALLQGKTLVGDYTARAFQSDIFFGPQEHTAANASFSIVLIFEEERLPPRTIVLFDGMQEVLGSTVTLSLGGFLVSPVPSGDLTFYVQEGDCNPGPEDCDTGNNLSGAERVRIISADPSRNLILSDAINPPNDIFNRTINTVDPPLKNVPGTDIDTFDITSALRAGDREITVELTSPAPRGSSGELMGLVYVIVGIDVFLPELRLDSRIEIATASGEILEKYAPGEPLRVAYALSNTGNLPATGVSFAADMPADVVAFEVIEQPRGATVAVDLTGGAFGKGRVTVGGAAVRHGEVDDLVLLVETVCPISSDRVITLTASVGAAVEGGLPFTMTSSVTLFARDRCGPQFFLYGGGGCSAAPVSRGPLWPLVLLGGLLVLRRRRVWALFLSLFFIACGGDVEVLPDLPPPPIFGVACPGDESMIVVPAIRGRPAFCIDRFEASGDAAGLGNVDQRVPAGDGSTRTVAQSARFAQPLSGVSWYQARAACANANKRLCRADEWLTACRGSNDVTYPYGDAFRKFTCNGYDAGRGDAVEAGGMFRAGEGPDGSEVALGCVTEHGAYDMSGNVWEWNEDVYIENTRRGLVGGSFRSNEIGLRCVIEDNHAPPAEVDDTYGFRCCKDLP